MALTARQKVDAYRQRKQDALLCIEAGCWEPSPDAERCDKCADAHAKRQRDRRRAEDQPEEPEAT